MALTPNKTKIMNGVTVNEKIIPDGTRWTSSSKAKAAGFSAGSLYKKQQKLSGGTGKVQFVTIHNTDDLDNVHDDGEQYTRATYNENMGSVRVHFYVDDVCAWQNLKAGTGLFTSDPIGSAEVSWHSGDGSDADGGNMTSLSIEIIMNDNSAHDAKARDNGARAAAWLLWRHGLTVDRLVTHTYWVSKSAGKTFADRDRQCCNMIRNKKWCPTYIFKSNNTNTALKNWKDFKSLVGKYLYALGGNTDSGQDSSTETKPPAIKAGDLVKIASNATYYSGKSVPSWVKNQNWYVSEVSGNRAVINKNEKGTNTINSPINVKYLTVVGANKPSTPPPVNTGKGFKPRKVAPSATDRYWVHTSKGGLNECIKISSSNGSCLPNCVGYAWGRFYEITGKRPTLSRANAENWYGYTADGYKRSQTPVLGAVICWRKGQAGVSSDGAGHVAIVEEIKSNGDIVTSNSAYNGTRFYMQTITKASGYRLGSAYTFQGFILPPGSNAGSVPQEPSNLPYLVKVTASNLNIRRGAGTNYGVSGSIKNKGIYTIVDEADGKGANRWGKLKSGAGWISLDYTEKV